MGDLAHTENVAWSTGIFKIASQKASPYSQEAKDGPAMSQLW